MLFDFLPGLFHHPAPRADGVALTRVQSRLAGLAVESDDGLRARAAALRGARERPDFTTETIALVAESIRRTHGLTAYEVQLRAGLALAAGALVELATGEGKTLAALFPACCFALHGRGTHVATVNGYLAERDAAFARPVLGLLGLSVGLLRENDRDTAAKRAAYAADVTYGVGTEFGFDYLRDQLAIRAAGRTDPRFHEILLRRVPAKPALTQRGQAFAVIDEADSVLIDEARSPLIIAAGARRPSATPEIYRLADAVAAELQAKTHFAPGAHLTLTAEGRRLAFTRLTDGALLQLRRVWPQYVEHALRVRHQFRRDVHYVISEDRVMIVDEFTGRLCPDRTWREGLHQAAEARAGVIITEENFSEATISRPAYFQLYGRICGMSGTATEAAPELRESYALRTRVIPPHRPCQRVVWPDRVFATRAAKYAAVVREVAARQAAGQPVLIGTRTIENSEALAAALVPLGFPLRLLNAKQDAEEAAIVEQAGQPGVITIATNMAGRGAHIPVPEESLRAGGLHVIALERHESGRIDRQLIGRAARQGQPGSAQFFLSLEDDLLQRHAPTLAARMAATARGGELPSASARHFLRTQRRIEALDRTQRRALAARHRWLDELKHAL